MGANGEVLVDYYPVVKPYAYATIVELAPAGQMVYKVLEPPLSSEEREVYDRIRRLMVDTARIDVGELRREDLRSLLHREFERVLRRYRIRVPEEARGKLLYYLERDMLGYGKIDVLMRDPKIEDISCDGVGVPVYVWHTEYESIPTNVVFETPEEVRHVLIRLSFKAGKQITVAQPVVEGSLPEGYRVHLTLDEISRKGGTFTIRKFREIPFSIVDLVKYGTVSPLLAAYVWLALENKRSLMVIGATASGKTTTLNAFATFIRPEAKIVTIEDTPELNLEHENWAPLVTRPSHEEWVRNVDLFDLLRSALRMRPDYIIVGEVRGEEAFTLYQAIATGHAGLCTMHAENVDYAVKRLISPPMNVPHYMIPLMNIYMVIERLKVNGRIVRRITHVYEAEDMDPKTGTLKGNLVFRYNPAKDAVEYSGSSILLRNIAERQMISVHVLEEELRRRERIISWLLERGVTGFREIGKVVRDYYLRPEEVYSLIRAGAYMVVSK